MYLYRNLTRGVGRFREILRAVETRTTQNLRMVSFYSCSKLMLEYNEIQLRIRIHRFICSSVDFNAVIIDIIRLLKYYSIIIG